MEQGESGLASQRASGYLTEIRCARYGHNGKPKRIEQFLSLDLVCIAAVTCGRAVSKRDGTVGRSYCATIRSTCSDLSDA